MSTACLLWHAWQYFELLIFVPFLSEYFSKKVEEKKEVEKEEEEEDTLSITSCTPSAVAQSGQKKEAKPGFCWFPCNILYNTKIDKDAKILPAVMSETLKTSDACLES